MYRDERAMYRFGGSPDDPEQYPDAWLEGVPPKPRLYYRLPGPNPSDRLSTTLPANPPAKSPLGYLGVPAWLAAIGLLVALFVRWFS